MEVYVDDLIAAMQGTAQDRTRVRTILFHALDSIFRPLDQHDSPHRRAPLSMKKLRQGDCTWATQKQILGWVVDTVNMVITLPLHRLARLYDLLDSLPPTQRRTSTKKWHQVLGELRSMAIALPGSRGMFNHLQHALQQRTTNNRIHLSKHVHQELADFRFLADTLAERPTRIAEIVPLVPSITGDHDASGLGAGGVVVPDATLQP